MKKLVLPFLFIFSLVCSSSYQVILKTSLEITIRNRLGNTVEGAEIKIFETREDFDAVTNQVGETALTDAKGKVLFKELKGIPYFVSAVKGELNNFGESEMTDSLTVGRRNRVTIIIN